MRFLYTFILFTFIFSACKKSEIEQLPVDTSSVDTTVSEITIENYIERTYRLVYGRDPDNAEESAAFSLLSSANVDSSSRWAFINSIFQYPEYRKNFYNESRLRILDGVDTSEFSNWIYIFQIFLQDASYQGEWPFFQYELDRMLLMRNAYTAFIKDSISMAELQRRMCDNYIYDQMHQGTANYVVSTFQNLINRNPLASEQQSSILMVNGSNSILFQENGSSKNEFLNIFVQSNEYYEGQVVLMYLKYMSRVPGTTELSDGTQEYFSTKDFTSVQRDILTTDEFIGIQ